MTRSRASAVFGVCAISTAAALWLNHQAIPPVADAVGCPGLLEWTASLAATVRPATPLAATLIVWHRIAIAATAALTAFASWRLTRSLSAAVAVGAVAAASPLLLPTLAPPTATALAVAAAAWLAVISGGFVSVIVLVTILGAMAPALSFPLAAFSFWIARRRAGSLIAAAVALTCLGVAVSAQWAVPALPGADATLAAVACLTPARSHAAAAWHTAAEAGIALGPLALALAALGIFAAMSRRRAQDHAEPEVFTTACALVIATAAAAFWPATDSARAFAPLIIGAWLLVGRGLAEIIGASGATWRQRRAGVALTVVLVGVNTEPRIRVRPTATEAQALLGHDRLSRRDFQTLLYALPIEAALVEEDAVTNVLLRSLSRSLQRSRHTFTVIARSPEAARQAHSSGAVRPFAFPRAQQALRVRGVRLADGLTPAVAGIAEIVDVLPCDLLTTTWTPVRTAVSARRLAFVVETETARGPIVLYTGGPNPIDATAVAWPSLALRGFITRHYDLSDPNARQALLQEAATDVAPVGDASLAAPFAARTDLWRVPGAPRALVIELSSMPSAAMAVQLPHGAGPVSLCPVYPFDVRAFADSGIR